MSHTETESENQVTSSTGNTEETSETSIENKAKNSKNEDISKEEKSANILSNIDANEVSTNEANTKNVNVSEVAKKKIECKSVDVNNLSNEKAVVTIESSKVTAVEIKETKDVQDQLQEILGDSFESPSKGTEDSLSKITSNVTTENLLSVLEDDTENQPKNMDENSPDSKKEEHLPCLSQPTANKSIQDQNKSQSVNKLNLSVNKPQLQLANRSSSQAINKALFSGSFSKVSASPEKKPEPSKASKRYIYKLKSKSGKVLKYTSTVPIVLKKPVIMLTKMVEEEAKSDYSSKSVNEIDEVDSDSSTKENMKENDALNDNKSRVVKRGRPKGVSHKKLSASSEERNSSDTGDSKNTPAFGMQTRKRQIKFLPDGRVVTPGKRSKLEYESKYSEESSLTESDEDSDSDFDYDVNVDRKVNKSNSSKKYTPAEKQSTEKKGKFKKVFDFESYFREKTSTAAAETREQGEKTTNKMPETSKNKLVSNSSTVPTSKKVTSVDPAQLLSSLIGVPIAPSQLNVVKFKPKVIQERTNAIASTTKKVTFEEEKTKRSTPSNQTELLKNTPFKVVSKPTFQKILPKPSSNTLDKTPVMKKVLEHRTISTSTPVSSYSVSPKVTPENMTNDVSKFDSFTDSKIVKTKAGPKKVMKRKSPESSESPKTIYDIMNQVFDQMPSWNLHIIPDTHSFCIAQVSRGRMGIPILKKSIELNAEFFAKVYVHQLHCKRYDGVYDTESKIINLIREIDALAA